MSQTMDLTKLLQALEEFVYEIALWPILLPRTLLRFAFQPVRTDAYVREELGKPVSERYSKYMSPILFWLLIAVVPCFLTMDFYAIRGKDLMGTFGAEGIEVRFAALIIFLVWMPLTFAVGLLIQMKIPLTRESLRPVFYAQCMSLAPFYIFFLIIFVSIFNSVRAAQPPPPTFPIWLSLNTITGALLLWLEGRILRMHLSIGWFSAVCRILLTWVLGAVLAIVLELSAFALLLGFSKGS